MHKCQAVIGQTSPDGYVHIGDGQARSFHGAMEWIPVRHRQPRKKSMGRSVEAHRIRRPVRISDNRYFVGGSSGRGIHAAASSDPETSALTFTWLASRDNADVQAQARGIGI